ncbi:hypothetical protein [Geobacter sp.]|uniref:hypothetical protein n=1 Tax=Geobacter sp. TaxID=46610 RepID=UPI0026287447|nr:hypothetical protein [Geobacter sp.]
MNRIVSTILAVALPATLLLFPSAARAAKRLTLTMAPANITFPDQDPDAFPVTAATSTVSVTVNTSGMGGAQWSLTALSRGELLSAGSSIPISSISWTATNQPTFRNGSMTATVPGTLVARNSGNGTWSGVLSFTIQNLWTYATGIYTQTTDFTVSSP